MAKSQIQSVLTALLIAGTAGAALGVITARPAAPNAGRLAAVAKDAAVAIELQRRRPPQPGDRWRGCHDARAVGTAPIYRGEPGYDEMMDGDGDGIACEAAPT